jgi:hypothetical protein
VNVLGNGGAMGCDDLRLGWMPIVYGELVSVIKQALCDPASHVTEANESEFHLICTKLLHRVSIIS